VSCAEPLLHRSYLYAPGNAPRVMAKALAAGADAVILDLEDAVAPAAKQQARTEVAAVVRGWAQGGPTAGSLPAGPATGDADRPGGTSPRQPRCPDLHVRINREGDGYLDADLLAVVRPGLAALRLPKVESVEAVVEVGRRLDELEAEHDLAPGTVRLYPTIESARGVVSLTALAAASPRIVRFAIGVADLLADLGAAGDDHLATLHVRSELVLRSRVAELGPPIDSVHTLLDDDTGLREGAARARALGFHGKSIIHPRQLDIVHDVFTPTAAARADAARIVAALEAADRDGEAALIVDGRFVDPAVAARARAILSL